MQTLIEKNKDKIIDLCKKHYVKELFVFGSVVTEKFNNESDVDFLYLIDTEKFKDWATGNYDYTDNLLSLENQLRLLLQRNVDLVPKDILMHNKYMKKSIEQTKSLIYAA
jgi:predicted nucleotidyltransferase